MEISATLVKELRNKTGVGFMDAKKALVEASGDLDKAIEILRQKGTSLAEKKSGRETTEGLVSVKIDTNKGVIFSLKCETDFVAKDEKFKVLARSIGRRIISNDCDGITASINETIGVIKENITFGEYTLMSYDSSSEALQYYIHTGSKLGVLVKFLGSSNLTDFEQLTKDISMHIASFAPDFIDRTQVDQTIIDEEIRIEMGREDIQNKPENIRENIVKGRVSKMLAQRCLVDQLFVKDQSKTIQQILDEFNKQNNTNIKVIEFKRLAL